MEAQDQQYHLRPGADVFGADGGKFGKVRTWDRKYLIVEKGLLFTTDYYVPFSAVDNYTEEEVFLKVTKEAAQNHGWDLQPSDMTTENAAPVEENSRYVI